MSKNDTNDWKIPLYKIYTDDEDVNIITKIIKRGNNWAVGPEIEQFEHALSNYVGTDYCITLNSGTSALHSTLLAYEIGTNDEVIVPSFSFISTVNSVLFELLMDGQLNQEGLQKKLRRMQFNADSELVAVLEKWVKILSVQNFIKNEF